MMIYFSVHKVSEGHIAVYYRGGALLHTTATPGYNVMMPLITTYRLVQTTMQTNSIKNVPCQTSGGVAMYFDFEVVTTVMPQAIYDLVHKHTADYHHALIHTPVLHVMNKFCSAHTMQEVYFVKYEQMDDIMKKALEKELEKMAPGLYVQVVRVTKPKIPDDIQRDFELMEKKKTELLVANERKKLMEKEAEIARRKAVLEAEKVAEVARIQHNQKIMEKEKQRKIAEIENAANLEQMKARAEAESLKAAEEAKIKAAKELAEREEMYAFYFPIVLLGVFVFFMFSILVICVVKCCRRRTVPSANVQTPLQLDSDDSSSSEDDDIPTTSAFALHPRPPPTRSPPPPYEPRGRVDHPGETRPKQPTSAPVKKRKKK